MQYKDLFFDLDRTLWDFESNALDTLMEMYDKHTLRSIFPDFNTFYQTYKKNNRTLWEKYREGAIKKERLKYQRFLLTIKEFGISDESLAKALGEDYVNLSGTKTKLFPNTHETLAYLQAKYRLHIITNGFEEVQYKKIQNCNLEKYFKYIITSEKAGVQKPHSSIFSYALKRANAKKEESIMIGDDLEGDIIGARSFGIDQVFFNPNHKSHDVEATYEIHTLKELMNLF